MALLPVNIGAAPNDGSGDPLRTAFGRTNTNTAALGGGYQTPTALAAGGTALSANKNYSTTLAANVVYQPLPAGEDGDWIEVIYNVTAPSSINLHTNSTVFQVGGGQLTAPVNFGTGTHKLSLRKAGGRWVAEASSLTQAGGVVELHRQGYPVAVFTPTASTEADATVALRAALAVANLTPTVKADIHLRHGRYFIASGTNLRSSAPAVTDTAIIFEGRSAVIYQTPADAGNDSMLYRGARNVWNFGADPTGTVDSQPAFLATRYSFAPVDGISKSEGSPGAGPGAGEILIRMGYAIVPQGIYHMHDTFAVQAYQSWVGVGGRVHLFWVDGVGGAGPAVRYAFSSLRSIIDGVALANFTHNVVIEGMIWGASPTGNDFLSSGLLAGAQSSRFCRMGVSGFTAGLIWTQYSDYWHLEDVDVTNILGTGPGAHFFECNLFTGINVSILGVNQRGLFTGTGGKLQAAFRFDACREMTFISSTAESCPIGVLIYGSNGVKFDGLEHLNIAAVGNVPGNEAPNLAALPLAGTAAFDVNASSSCEVTAGHSKYSASFVTIDDVNVIPGQGLAHPASVLTAFDLTTNKYVRSLRYDGAVMRTAAADPVAANILDGTSVVWRNSTTGQVKLWSNFGGTLKSVALT